MPYLGLCLGLQCGVIEFARDVVGEQDANSTEFDLFTDAPVIDLMPDQREVEDKGGTHASGPLPRAADARLARARPPMARRSSTSAIATGSRSTTSTEKRWSGAACSSPAQSPDGRLVEIVELRDHPWFVASQFHPEFKSRPDRPHPLFRAFVRAAMAGPGDARATGSAPGDDTAATRQPVQVVTVEPAR